MRITEPIEGRQLTTIRMGGPLLRLIETEREEELIGLIRTFRSRGEPFVVIGSGSNIVFPPAAESLTVLRYTGNRISDSDAESLQIEGGCTIASLMGWSLLHRRSGLEFLIGIPGTVGGTLAVNAGAFGESLGDRLISADVIDSQGQRQTWSAEDFSFSYRSCRIKYGQEIVLRARLRAVPSSDAEIRRRMSENIRYRMGSHPVKEPSAGCFFKNPKPGKNGISAGRLIDQCGLKGLCRGNLQVSPRHANFILNLGRADLDELAEFSRFIEERVKTATGITLEREVIWIDSRGRKS